MDSEIISREIILKLITNTIYTNENKRINQEIAPHCTSFSINDMINPIIAQTFASFDYDDSDQSQKVLYQDIIFFDNKRIEENTWFEIKEPECPSEDRCCPSKIQIGVYEEKPKEDIAELQNSVEHSRMHTFILRLNEEEQQPEENKKIDVIELPSYDLTLKNYDDQNSPELQALREEFEEKKAKLLLEKKKEELMIEWKKKEEIEMKKPKKKKDFNFKKIRFDCTGNIIDFKPLKMNDLKKEFSFLKTNIQKIDNDTKYHRKKIKKEKTEIIYNPNTGDYGQPPQKKKEKEEIKIQPMGSNYDIMFPEIGVRITEGKSTKGGNKEFGKKYNKISNADFDKYLHEFIPTLNSSKYHATLRGNTNDVSVEEQSNIITEEVEGNIQTEVNSSSINPLLENVQITNNSIINNSSILQSSYLQSSRICHTENNENSIKMNSKRYNMSSLKMTLDSLDNLDDGFFDAYSNQSIIKKRRYKIFNSNFKIDKEKKNQTVIDNESINKFNSSILKDKNWGSEDIIQSKQIDFNKPKKGNILRELGMSIVMTKLPRSRKYNTSKYNMIKED